MKSQEIFYLNARKMLEYLLFERYQSQFESIDGVMQHPSGLNYFEWIEKMVLAKERKMKPDTGLLQ